MTHRSEYFASKTQSSVAVNAEADTTAGDWAIVYGGWRSLAQTGRSTHSILETVAHASALVQPGGLVEQSITISVIIAALRVEPPVRPGLAACMMTILFAAMHALSTLHYLLADVRGLARLQL
jgi:hypothetical protein